MEEADATKTRPLPAAGRFFSHSNLALGKEGLGIQRTQEEDGFNWNHKKKKRLSLRNMEQGKK